MELLKNWLQVWGLQIVSCAFNANQKGLLSLNWSESPSYLHLALSMQMHLYHQKGLKVSALTILYIEIWEEI